MDSDSWFPEFSLFVISGGLGHGGFWFHYKGLHAFGMTLIIFSCMLLSIFCAGLDDPEDEKAE